MCKVLIKEVVKVLNSVSGGTKESPWERFEFDCLVSVDGSEQSAVRRIKTFDAGIAKQLVNFKAGETLTFEAKPYGEKPHTSFTLEVPRKGAKAQSFKGMTSAETNRQAALRMASELAKIRAHVDGEAPTVAGVIEDAEKLLVWLEQGGSK